MRTDEPAGINTYRDLKVWQKAMDLVVASYELAKRLPTRENYGLTSQIQRAAVSIPANIAEGMGASARVTISTTSPSLTARSWNWKLTS